MATLRHLWAVGYDDMKRASEVRDEIARKCLNVAIADPPLR